LYEQKIFMNSATSITWLFVPGDRPERFTKALASGAGMVVIDLEDAVAADGKEAARECVRAALADGHMRACVRINAPDTEWFDKDCQMLGQPGVAAVMLPKADSAAAVARVRAACAGGTGIVPLIETAAGLAAAADIARCPGVLQLAFGSVDFQLDMGIEGDGMELLFARSQLVLASRLAGIAAPIDGVTLSVTDVAQVRADALQARRLGFGGKLCIHPAQVVAVHEAFSPDAKALAWARGVLEAVSSTSSGALTYEGKLIDKPVITRARALLDRAGSQAAQLNP
jgi:citrate lyase subunit beta/citryl-CoA lyase